MPKRPTKLLGGVAALAVTAPLLIAPATGAAPKAHAAGAPSVGIVSTGPKTFAFSPSKVKIVAGRRVNWSWSGSAEHNVTFSKSSASATTNTGSFSRKFNAPGKYTFVCTVHGFTGKVVVK